MATLNLEAAREVLRTGAVDVLVDAARKNPRRAVGAVPPNVLTSLAWEIASTMSRDDVGALAVQPGDSIFEYVDPLDRYEILLSHRPHGSADSRWQRHLWELGEEIADLDLGADTLPLDRVAETASTTDYEYWALVGLRSNHMPPVERLCFVLRIGALHVFSDVAKLATSVAQECEPHVLRALETLACSKGMSLPLEDLWTCPGELSLLLLEVTEHPARTALLNDYLVGAPADHVLDWSEEALTRTMAACNLEKVARIECLSDLDPGSVVMIAAVAYDDATFEEFVSQLDPHSSRVSPFMRLAGFSRLPVARSEQLATRVLALLNASDASFVEAFGTAALGEAEGDLRRLGSSEVWWDVMNLTAGHLDDFAWAALFRSLAGLNEFSPSAGVSAPMLEELAGTARG